LLREHRVETPKVNARRGFKLSHCLGFSANPEAGAHGTSAFPAGGMAAPPIDNDADFTSVAAAKNGLTLGGN
jgi:hypothetical protein